MSRTLAKLNVRDNKKGEMPFLWNFIINKQFIQEHSEGQTRCERSRIPSDVTDHTDKNRIRPLHSCKISCRKWYQLLLWETTQKSPIRKHENYSSCAKNSVQNNVIRYNSLSSSGHSEEWVCAKQGKDNTRKLIARGNEGSVTRQTEAGASKYPEVDVTNMEINGDEY